MLIISDPSRVLPETMAAMIWLGIDPTDTDAHAENKSRVVDCLMYLNQAAANGELRYYDKQLTQEIPVANTQRTVKVFSYSFTMQSLLDFAKSKNHRLGTSSSEKPADAAADKPESTRKSENLLRALACIAIDAYGYDPKSGKSTAPKDIADALSKLGQTVDPKTIRNWLKEGVELLPPNPHKD